jgi:TPR repeat protein
MFHYAASYFSDPNAQYSLARLYLDGSGVEKDARLAARWFNLAAEKGHHPSQALLGHLLMNGQGAPRQRAKGLMWLTLAREAADAAKDAWISDLYEKAFAAASENDRKLALAYLEQHLQRR